MVSLKQQQDGALMIEVMISIVILVIGLMAIYEMQARLQRSELEAYQRTQAVILLNDMAQRINANRAWAGHYVSLAAVPGGTGGGTTCSDIGTSTLYHRDLTEWCEALQGAAEVQSGGNVGAMIGGRGCVEELVPGTEYRVTVVWQGLTPISAPPTSITCGAGGTFNDSTNGSDCTDDLCRRYVATVVRIAELDL